MWWWAGKRGSTGAAIARVTSVLTATRFMVVFYTPLVVVACFTTSALCWMSWVWLRHASMHDPSKKDDYQTMDASSVLNEVYNLEHASVAINMQLSSTKPEQLLPPASLVSDPPSAAAPGPAATEDVRGTAAKADVAPPSSSTDPDVRAFYEAKMQRREQQGMCLRV